MVQLTAQEAANINKSTYAAKKYKLGDRIRALESYAHADTNGAPSNAQLITSFGAVATVGAGFRGTFKDDHAGGKIYFVACDGSAYYVVATSAAA